MACPSYKLRLLLPLPHMEKRMPVIMRPQAIAPLVPPFLDQSHSVPSERSER